MSETKITPQIETMARRMAAAKMGLVKDPHGERLPDDLWRQCVKQAEAAIKYDAAWDEFEAGNSSWAASFVA